MKQVINCRLVAIYVIIALCIIQDAVDLQMSMFLYYTPNFTCQPNTSIFVDSSRAPIYIDPTQCHFTQNNITHDCINWRFDNTFLQSTVVTDLQLVCSHEYLQLLIVPMRNLAGLTFMFFGYIGDFFGRKIFFVVLSILEAFLWLIIAVIPPSYPGHLIARVLKSMVKGNMAIGYVLLGELTPRKYRDTVLLNFYVFYGIGIAIASLYMKTMQYWSRAYLLASAFNVYVFLAPFVLLESPYWLAINGKKDEAREVLIKLGQLSKDSLLQDNLWSSTDELIVKKSVKSEFIKYVKCSTLMIRFLILAFTSFVYCLIYYGISTNLNFSISDIFINAVVLGVIEIPASPLGALVANKIGVNRTIISTGILAVVMYAISPANYNSGIAASRSGLIIHIVLSMLAKLFLIISWNTQALLFIALSPTSLRNLILSIVTCIGIIGSAVGAFIGYYCQRKGSNLSKIPILVYGVTLIGSVILIYLFFPSIDNVPLPNTVDDCIEVYSINNNRKNDNSPTNNNELSKHD